MSTDQKSYWQIQDPDKSLYSDLIWSQPQHKSKAGKLLIVGGNVHGFSAVAKAYNTSQKAGAGSVRVLLPDRLKKTIGSILPDAYYGPSTPSGSFAKNSLAELLEHAQWADLVLIAGDLGRNSETAMLIETFYAEHKGPLTITKDGLDFFTASPASLVSRRGSLIVGTIAQLQKISLKAYPNNLITFSMSLMGLVEALHFISLESEASFITMHENNIVVAHKGRVSTTKSIQDPESWRVIMASYCSVWWLQNLDQTFEALTTAVYSSMNNL